MEQKIRIERDATGRPGAIAFGSSGYLYLDATINQDMPLLAVVVFALNQLPDQQLDAMIALASRDAERSLPVPDLTDAEAAEFLNNLADRNTSMHPDDRAALFFIAARLDETATPPVSR